MNQKDVFAAAVIVIVSVMTALMGYGLVQLFDSISGGDPLAHEEAYGFSGTVDGSPVSGTGESRYGAESESLRVYSFHFVSEGPALFETTATLLCDGSGRPTSEFSRVGDGPGGTEAWSRTEDGTLFTYYVGDNCLVRSLTMHSGSIDIRADLTA